MARYLFAWELGGGLGHVGNFVPVARALHDAGHQVAFALRDLRSLAAIDPGADIPVFQAPVCTYQIQGLADPPLNYAEILMRYGYLDSEMLYGLVAGWRRLVATTGAEIMVADHSPSAMLAARILGIRCVLLGNAFIVPPQVSPTPTMRPWMNIPEMRLASSDKRILDTMNKVLTDAGSPALAHIYQLFDVHDITMCTTSSC